MNRYSRDSLRRSEQERLTMFFPKLDIKSWRHLQRWEGTPLEIQPLSEMEVVYELYELPLPTGLRLRLLCHLLLIRVVSRLRLSRVRRLLIS